MAGSFLCSLCGYYCYHLLVYFPLPLIILHSLYGWERFYRVLQRVQVCHFCFPLDFLTDFCWIYLWAFFLCLYFEIVSYKPIEMPRNSFFITSILEMSFFDSLSIAWAIGTILAAANPALAVAPAWACPGCWQPISGYRLVPHLVWVHLVVYNFLESLDPPVSLSLPL